MRPAGAVTSSSSDLSSDIFGDDPLADAAFASRGAVSLGSGGAEEELQRSATLQRELVGARAALARLQSDAEQLAEKLLASLAEQQRVRVALASQTQLNAELHAQLLAPRSDSSQASEASEALRKATDALRSLSQERGALQAQLAVATAQHQALSAERDHLRDAAEAAEAARSDMASRALVAYEAVQAQQAEVVALRKNEASVKGFAAVMVAAFDAHQRQGTRVAPPLEEVSARLRRHNSEREI